MKPYRKLSVQEKFLVDMLINNCSNFKFNKNNLLWRVSTLSLLSWTVTTNPHTHWWRIDLADRTFKFFFKNREEFSWIQESECEWETPQK